MDDRQAGWERAVGPLAGGLLVGAALVLLSGAAATSLRLAMRTCSPPPSPSIGDEPPAPVDLVP